MGKTYVRIGKKFVLMSTIDQIRTLAREQFGDVNLDNQNALGRSLVGRNALRLWMATKISLGGQVTSKLFKPSAAFQKAISESKIGFDNNDGVALSETIYVYTDRFAYAARHISLSNNGNVGVMEWLTANRHERVARSFALSALQKRFSNYTRRKLRLV
jgi:hypothetical protein